jgi:hypothetical protein
MSLPTDISLVDYVMETEDNILILDMDSVSKSDQKYFEGIDISYSFVARKSYI